MEEEQSSEGGAPLLCMQMSPEEEEEEHRWREGQGSRAAGPCLWTPTPTPEEQFACPGTGPGS